VPADSPRLRMSPGFAQFCAAIVIAIILVLTGCMAIPAARESDPVSELLSTSTTTARPAFPSDTQGAALTTESEHVLVTAATDSRLALAKRCSWAGNRREGTSQHAAFGRSRPRSRRTTCRSNLPVGTVSPGTHRLA